MEEIKENAEELEVLGNSWKWPTGNYAWELHTPLENTYSEKAKENIRYTQNHIDKLFNKHNEAISARDRKKLDLLTKGCDNRNVQNSMIDYDKISNPIFGEITAGEYDQLYLGKTEK